MDRLWDDFGPILGRFWVHAWLIFGSFWLRLGCFWLLSCIELPYKHVHRHVRRFIHARAHTCPQITYMSCNANALPVPCSHRFMLGLFFSVLFSVSFSLRSWAGPRRFWSPTWPQLGSILELCWALFGTFLGVVLASSLKIAFRHDFDGFLIDSRPSEGTKTLKIHCFLMIFVFLLARS